jgi:Clp amino terminal domain, pathogenicity island component
MIAHMFERFTEQARQVVVLAQEEARILKHNYIGTEHILLGLLREQQSLAALVLKSLDMTVERVRAQVVQIVGSGKEASSGQIPFTPRAKKVLELGLREALTLDHDDVATYHILLGLLREQEGVAARVLRDFGLDVQEVRDRVLAELDAAPDEGSPRRKKPAPEPSEERSSTVRDKLLGRLEQHHNNEPTGPAPAATGMFQRFTERAKHVVVLAQEEARDLKHNHIGTEHILLGLLREEESLAARVLASLDVSVEEARAGVVGRVGPEEVASGHIPITPRAKKVLELSLREALSLGHNYIGTEHILLGLAREGEGVANHVLLDFGADSQKVRNEVIRMLSGPSGRPRSGGKGAVQFGTGESSLERIGFSDALLDGAGPALRSLVDEVEQRVGRSADAGDLLVLLSSVPEGIAARALAGLGVDVERLARAVEEARRDGARSALLPPAALLAECDKIRAEKEAAIAQQEFARATELRERERELLNQALTAAEERQDQMLAEVRARLRLSGE